MLPSNKRDGEGEDEGQTNKGMDKLDFTKETGVYLKML